MLIPPSYPKIFFADSLLKALNEKNSQSNFNQFLNQRGTCCTGKKIMVNLCSIYKYRSSGYNMKGFKFFYIMMTFVSSLNSGKSPEDTKIQKEIIPEYQLMISFMSAF